MQIFDIVNEDLFRPLTGINKRRYVDVLSLLWDKCKRMPMYAVEKSTIIDEVESYFIGLGERILLDESDNMDDAELAYSSDCRVIATVFLRKLKSTGWLDEKEGEYENESSLAINYKIIPIISAFIEIVNPKFVTYKGKLFKIFTLLNSIEKHSSPYEAVLKEVSEDMVDLNLSLRQLAASIEEHIDVLTKGKTPEEVLKFFEKYEEKIVIGAYHRFKTNDNLFYYRTSLYEQLDLCETDYLNMLVKDFSVVEQKDEIDSVFEVKRLISKMREDVQEMESIMRVIDNRHILYRTRAVQRAQFLLLSDGSVKGKINGLLQYYATQIRDKDELFEYDETTANSMFQIYGQNYYSYESLATPSSRKKPTEIELMTSIEALDAKIVEGEQNKLLEYAKNALTSENVNSYAKEILHNKKAVSAGSIFRQDESCLVKIIGLFTYSQAYDRTFDIITKDNYVVHAGVKFKDFIIEERKK
ncbi:Wadjet anti-phage system protein JetA family protein [Ruminiclostridium cellobioparum]|uniref:TIGR02677 family protein n=1 Tax=Ruminiclostridium cellobioparum subsp. termitidis CT1112 TaxID=1195236 RepID=S0FQE5_RUMCE|nr:Wadjet anti-phage system protein JetA family protein [Ruminiclostridium cellobioparum]EMS72591.1 hypothetical protein CTER_1521 [Ruminiclostridium cellobioparum subsp. termitidis CT1112]